MALPCFLHHDCVRYQYAPVALYKSEITVQHPPQLMPPRPAHRSILHFFKAFHMITLPPAARDTPLSEKTDTAVSLRQRISTL